MTSRPHADWRIFILLASVVLGAASLPAQTPAKAQSVIPLYRSLQSVGLDPQKTYKFAKLSSTAKTFTSG